MFLFFLVYIKLHNKLKKKNRIKKNKMNFDNNRALERLKEFCFPRLTGTDSLKEARDIIHKKLKENVPNAAIEEFKCNNELKRVLRFWAPVFLGLIILKVIFWEFFYLLSIVFAIAQFSLNLIVQGRIGHVQVYKRFKNKGPVEGYNVIGKISAREEEKKILVIGAHYDTKSGLAWKRKNSDVMTYSVLLVNLLFVIFAILRIFIDDSVVSWFTMIIWVGSAIEFLSTAIFTLSYSVFNESPGANDNGSGVAVILELAAIFSKQVPKNMSLILVLFDAEEIGLQGAAAAVNFHHEELSQKDPWMVNLDEVAADKTIKVVTRGGLPAVNHGGALNSIFEKAIDNNEILSTLKKEKKLVINAKTLSSQSDHAPFFVAGIPSVYISTGNKKRHSANDNWEAMTPESIERTGILVEEFIKTLDVDLSNS